MRRLSCFLSFVVALLWLSAARAANVAILRPASDAPDIKEALFRLKGELLAVGLAVTLEERPPAEEAGSSGTRAWLERSADEQGIDAVIDVVGDSAPEAVEIWLWEGEPRQLRVTRVVLEPNAASPAATLAIRSIEVLRSRLIAGALREPAQPPAPAPAAAPAPAPEANTEYTKPATEASGRFGISAGATALTSLDGVGLALLPLVRLDWALSSLLTLQATAAGFGTRPRIVTEAGNVDVTQKFALLGLCACVPLSPRVHAVAALAGGVLHTALVGRAVSPNSGQDVEGWALLTEASLGAELRLLGGAYLTLAAHAQLAEPYVAIHSVDSVVATTGRPNLRFTITAGAWL
jgi:hypothetical protein